MKPVYDLDKIKFSSDRGSFERAVELYEKGKVTKFKKSPGEFSAVVLGSEPYRVWVSPRRHDEGNCTCYLGRNDTLCKHMIAVAIYAVMNGSKLADGDKEFIEAPRLSGKKGELDAAELSAVKRSITDALKYIKSYSGPSKAWFAYQNSLNEGCSRLSKIITDLPVSPQTTKILIDLLLRLDEKLCSGGVDDSDGTVGGFMEEVVGVLKEYARLDPACVKAFKKLADKKTCFGWEAPLVEILDNDD